MNPRAPFIARVSCAAAVALFTACSADQMAGDPGSGGHAGTAAGTTGSAGTSGGAGTSGSAGTTGSAGTSGGAGTSGSGGTDGHSLARSGSAGYVRRRGARAGRWRGPVEPRWGPAEGWVDPRPGDGEAAVAAPAAIKPAARRERAVGAVPGRHGRRGRLAAAVRPPITRRLARPTTTDKNVGPNNGSTPVYRPQTLGQNGSRTRADRLLWAGDWHAGLAAFDSCFSSFASHGFLVVGTPVLNEGPGGASKPQGDDGTVSTGSSRQNTTAGSPYQGKLDVTHAISMGYSVGGTSAVQLGGHAAVATYGLDPRPHREARTCTGRCCRPPARPTRWDSRCR